MEYNKDDNRPILVQFENGPLKEETKSTIDFQYLKSVTPKSNKRLLVANCDNMLYSGTVQQKQQSLVKYYIGVVDKHTRRIESVHNVQLCTLKAKMEETSKAKMEETSSLVEKDKPDVKKSFREEADNLVAAFGSAKQKRLVASRKRNLGANESINEKVQDVAKKILVDSPVTSPTGGDSEGADLDEIIPKINNSAKTPSEMYNIGDVISIEDYRLLFEHAKEMTYCKENTLLLWKNEQKYPEFILYVLSQLSGNKPSVRRDKGCYICYLNYLIAFSKVSYRDVKSRNPCPAIPVKLQENILLKFTHSDENGKNRCVPKKLKDKLYCYIFILALFIEDFDMNCNLLLRDLKLGIGRVTTLLRAIGCTVRTENFKSTKIDERVVRAVLKNKEEVVSKDASKDASVSAFKPLIIKKENPE